MKKQSALALSICASLILFGCSTHTTDTSTTSTSTVSTSKQKTNFSFDEVFNQELTYEKLTELFEGDELESYPNKDLVFETEKERITRLNNFNARVEKEGKLSPDGKTLIVDNSANDGIDVIFTDGKTPGYCLETSPYQSGAGEWLGSRYFVYSYGKGLIMIYDLAEEKSAQLSPDFAFITEVGETYLLLEHSTTEGSSFSRLEFSFNEKGEISFDGIDLEWSNTVKEKGIL